MKIKYVFFLFAIIQFLNCMLANAQGGFTKVINGTNPVTTFASNGIYKGAAWIDFDNDGDIDLFAYPNKLFRNDGNGSFTALADLPYTPLEPQGGSSWADLDNDGDIDCIISERPSGAFLNDGAATFTNISAQIANLNTFPSWGCAIGNWNNDAFLDFIYAHAAGFHAAGPFPCKLYLNTNNSVTPQNIIGYAITDITDTYTVPYWSDYDLDGDMDLFIASGPGGTPGFDYCYKNMKVETGLDTLQLMTTELFATQQQDGQCYNFIDADNDGDLDLCLTNYAGAQTRLYENTGGAYLSHIAPFTTTTQNLTNCWGDYDNDGDLDVVITADASTSKLYLNNGSLAFSPAISIGSISSCGVTNGDYDNDGDLDLFFHGQNAGRALFENTSGNSNNWANIKCNGFASNKSAIGTIVKLKAVINGNPVWQLREINAQNSFQSQNDLRVHFGLGNATLIDSVIFIFSSGQTDVITNVSPNQFYCHDEGSNNLCLVTGVNEIRQDNIFAIFPNPTENSISIQSKNEAQIIDGWSIIDETGRIILSSEQKSIGALKIDVQRIGAGKYWINLMSEHKISSVAFLKP